MEKVVAVMLVAVAVAVAEAMTCAIHESCASSASGRGGAVGKRQEPQPGS